MPQEVLFMEVMPLYYMPVKEIFLVFIIFSVIGWCSEVLFVGIFSEHKFVNRGFLYGPLCPIYGFGGLVILLLPKQILDSWIPLFFSSMILCTAVEYFVSWLLEKLFHTLWWDYSDHKINLNGRICLENSILFGVMGLLVVHFVQPHILSLLAWLGDFWMTVSSEMIAAAMAIDLMITLRRLVDFNATMVKLREFGDSLRERYENEEWFHGETLGDMLAAVKARSEQEKSKFSRSFLERLEKIQGTHKNEEGFLARFPTLKSRQYKDGLAYLRQRMKEHKK